LVTWAIQIRICFPFFIFDAGWLIESGGAGPDVGRTDLLIGVSTMPSRQIDARRFLGRRGRSSRR
jgi:hypothetical protein